MSTQLIQVFDYPAALIAANSTVTAAGLKVVTQLDREFYKKQEASLRKADVVRPGDGPGVALGLWSAGGDPANGNSSQQLDLWNRLILVVSESPANNATGKSALEWVAHLLRLLHRGAPQGRQSAGDIRHPDSGPVYEIGPMEKGLVHYLIHLEVRSTEPLLTQ